MAKKRRRPSRGQMRQFGKMVRAAMGVSHVSRLLFEKTLTAATQNNTTLLNVDDDPDYDLATDGTNSAEAEAGSRLQSVQLRGSYFAGTTNAAGARVDWILYRSPDGAITTSTTPSDLFSADVTLTTALLRKNALAFGSFYSSANNDTKAFRVRISRKAIRRIRVLSDGDLLRFSIVTPATGAKILLYGRIVWKK